MGQGGEDFPELLEELRTYLGPEKPGQVVKAIPGQGTNVPITLLGSSTSSAQLAGMLGLPYAFAVGDELTCDFKVTHPEERPLPYWGIGKVVRVEGCTAAIELHAGGLSQGYSGRN